MSNTQPALPIIVVVGIIAAVALLWSINKHVAETACYDRALTLASLGESDQPREYQASLIRNCGK